MATRGSEQPDLFESAPQQTQAALAPLRRTNVLEQLQALLIEATEIREIRGRAVLDGVRGAAASDIGALACALSRLSVFAAENADRIESVDVNPFVLLPSGGVALDALIVTRTEQGAERARN